MKHQIGNILDVQQGIIIQQVNAQGVMGSGVAKAIREKYPAVWEVYSGIVQPGSAMETIMVMGRMIPVEVKHGLFVINIVGQQFYGKATTFGGVPRQYTSYDALDTGFAAVAKMNQHQKLPIHHPMIGCGLGGGDWTVVSALIEKHLGTETTLWTLPTS